MKPGDLVRLRYGCILYDLGTDLLPAARLGADAGKQGDPVVVVEVRSVLHSFPHQVVILHPIYGSRWCYAEGLEEFDETG